MNYTLQQQNYYLKFSTHHSQEDIGRKHICVIGLGVHSWGVWVGIGDEIMSMTKGNLSNSNRCIRRYFKHIHNEKVNGKNTASF